AADVVALLDKAGDQESADVPLACNPCGHSSFAIIRLLDDHVGFGHCQLEFDVGVAVCQQDWTVVRQRFVRSIVSGMAGRVVGGTGAVALLDCTVQTDGWHVIGSGKEGWCRQGCPLSS